MVLMLNASKFLFLREDGGPTGMGSRFFDEEGGYYGLYGKRGERCFACIVAAGDDGSSTPEPEVGRAWQMKEYKSEQSVDEQVKATSEKIIVYGKRIAKEAVEVAAEVSPAAAVGGSLMRGDSWWRAGLEWLKSRPEKLLGALKWGKEAALGLKLGTANQSKIISISERNLQKGYQKHGADFGLTGNWNPSRASEFSAAVNSHINNPSVDMIQGTYRGAAVTHYLDRQSGLNVMVDQGGNYVSGWKLSTEQMQSVTSSGRLF